MLTRGNPREPECRTRRVAGEVCSQSAPKCLTALRSAVLGGVFRRNADVEQCSIPEPVTPSRADPRRHLIEIPCVYAWAAAQVTVCPKPRFGTTAVRGPEDHPGSY